MSEVPLGEVKPYPLSGQGVIFDPQQGEAPTYGVLYERTGDLPLEERTGYWLLSNAPAACRQLRSELS